MKSSTLFAILLLMALPLFAQKGNNDPISKAKIFFKTYEQYEKIFDDKITKFFSDDAIIVINSDNIFDEKRKLEITGNEYKELILSTLEYAKNTGNFYKYSKIKFSSIKENQIKISGDRYSVLKKYYSPFTMILNIIKRNQIVIVYFEIHSK